MNFIKEHKQSFLNVALATVLALIMVASVYTKAVPAETVVQAENGMNFAQTENLTEWRPVSQVSAVSRTSEESADSTESVNNTTAGSCESTDEFAQSLYNDSCGFVYSAENMRLMVCLMEDTSSDFALINKTHTLNADFVPELTGSGKAQMKPNAAQALDEMLKAAQNQGVVLNKQSGYRSYGRQTTLYGSGNNEFRAAPGASEHQTGLAMDLVNSAASLNPELSTSAEAVWLAENAWKYGFVIRYTAEKESITGYPAEWWHVRYLGKTIAYELYHTGMAYEEFYEKCLNGINSTQSDINLTNAENNPNIN